MTSRLIGRFVSASEAATRERFGDGPLVRYAARLVVPDETRAECAVLKAVAAHFVMNAGERRSQMERERAVISGLVEGYQTDPTRLDVEEQADFAAAADDAARLRVVVDQVASLSDIRAWSVARAWRIA
jgi:dGTPase